jgi:2,5-furandicarboxylate decarboxylase 1
MDASESPQRAASLDFERFRLRNFVNLLAQADEVEIHSEPVALADVAKHLAESSKAVWFKKAGPEEAELVGNVDADRARLARAFGVPAEKLVQELARRVETRPEIVEVPRAAAPVQQVVLTGNDIDVTALPVHLQHGQDGGPYISASVDFAVDARTGWTNSGLRRLMLRGRRETGIDLNAPSDLRAIYMAAQARGEKLAVSFAIGSHPVDHVAATMRVPRDELELLASLRSAPLPVVKCVTNDIRVPADAEWVIEGYLDERGYVGDEGPYGEYLGYYGGMKLNPVFHVTAITRRQDALFQTLTISGRRLDRTETSQLETLRNEFNVWQALKTVVREPVAVYAPVAAGGQPHVRVALRQRVPGEARSAIHTVLGSTSVKHIFVVDPDIDIFSDAQMEWALATRFQADRSMVVMNGMRASPLDPSLNGAHTGAKVGFDLTWPMGKSTMEHAVPEPPTYEGQRFPSLRAALAHGPKSFEQLMAAVGSRDGREIVRELEALRAEPGFGRDKEGRYALGAKAGPAP